ncbi:SecY-interacting protein [Ferrimonas senticii]|uniref:SecY-interacting protein n=1 Tax=Ferrimonas senticii TaxID=394566 RepID=UPI00042176D5|nr:SecY-interacting protein [Ferrimonas senticii]
MSATALHQFHHRYQQHWLAETQGLPLTSHAEDGPAKTAEHPDGLSFWRWQPLLENKPRISFENVASALELQLHPSLNDFYGAGFGGALFFSSDFGDGELLQVWNEDDLQRLQQNLIGHLLMKQKLKQPATLFIGLLGQGEQMIVLDNQDGSVWLEVPGQLPQHQLAPTLHQFLDRLSPRVEIPEVVVEEPLPEAVGLRQRLQAMLAHLLPKKRG